MEKKNLLSEEHLCANALPVGTSISITDVSVSFTHHTLQKQESLLTGYSLSDSLLVTSCWLHGRSPYLGYLVRPLNGCKNCQFALFKRWHKYRSRMDGYWCYNEETTFWTIFCARAFVLRLTLPRSSLIEPLPSGAKGVMGRTEESVWESRLLYFLFPLPPVSTVRVTKTTEYKSVLEIPKPGKFLRRYRFSHILGRRRRTHTNAKYMTLRLSIDTNLDTNLVPSKIFSECMTSLPQCSPYDS